MPQSSTRSSRERAHSGRDHGHSMFNDVFSLASTVIGAGKHAGALKIFAVAESTRNFGEDLQELPHLQAYADAAAESLEDLADYLDHHELGDIIEDVGAFAKRQPVVAAALTLAAGIVLTQAVRNWRRTPPARSPSSRPRGRRARANGGGSN